MTVRGLGCPVRFTLTAGQKGDARQAAALIDGFPAEVVMADIAYDADHLRKAIAAKGELAVIPNNPSPALKYPLDKHLYAQRAISWSAASQSSSSSGASQPASRKPLETVRPWSPLPPSSSGCDKCPQDLTRSIGHRGGRAFDLHLNSQLPGILRSLQSASFSS